MLGKTWEDFWGTPRAEQPDISAILDLLLDLKRQVESIETYLKNTPNHIGQVYAPPVAEVAVPQEAEPVKAE